jgi:hypothetical protein
VVQNRITLIIRCRHDTVGLDVLLAVADPHWTGGRDLGRSKCHR